MTASSVGSLLTAFRGSSWRRLAVVVSCGLLVAGVSLAVTARLYKDSLQTRAATIASALDTDRIERLRNAPLNQPAATADYDYFKTKLAAIKQANDDARFVYVMARNAKGQVYFVVDSEPSSSTSYSPRGELYPEASPALKSMFNNGREVIEGPSRDSYGDWLSALAPLVNDRTYHLVGVVGIDVPSRTYVLLLSLAGGIPLLLTALAATVVTITAQTRRQRQEVERLRAEMVSLATHELRTPLTGLRWSQELLQTYKLSTKAKVLVAKMYDSTQRLQDSIEAVMQLASLDGLIGRGLVKRPADLRVLVADVVAMQHLSAEQHRLHISFTDDWPASVIVDCDAQRLKRVFNNIVSNAIKYSRSGTVITVDYRWDDTAKRHVVVVTDHGIGIPASEQTRVLTGFYRASNAIAAQAGGDGMGLYVSRSMVEQHGGELRLESRPDSGTTVFVSLP